MFLRKYGSILLVESSLCDLSEAPRNPDSHRVRRGKERDRATEEGLGASSHRTPHVDGSVSSGSGRQLAATNPDETQQVCVDHRSPNGKGR